MDVSFRDQFSGIIEFPVGVQGGLEEKDLLSRR